MTRSFTYSASGNVTLDDLGGSGTVLTYNSLDRLVRVSAVAVTLVDYVYAATGQRAIKTTPTATTHYLYDPGGALYAETDGAGNVLREYITLGGATLAIIDALGVGYVHDDHLGTPQVMTDGSAAVVWDASYRPFGEATIAGAAANEQRFPGQTADAETGWHDNWHRTYDPGLGRYLQSDPIGLAGGWNTYGYAGGNPVRYIDPKGLAIGDYPPAPPGYDPAKWLHGQWPNGREYVVDPKTRTVYTVHPEDKGHWRHWDKRGPGNDDEGTWPPNSKKPWPNQKRKLKPNQCENDPSGDTPPWTPGDLIIADPFTLPGSPVYNPFMDPSIPIFPLPGEAPSLPPNMTPIPVRPPLVPVLP